MKQKYKITLFLLTLLIISISLIGVSYSFSSSQDNLSNDSLVITNEELSINYFTSDTIYDELLEPNEEIEINFSVTNGSSLDLYYSFGIDEVINIIDGDVLINLTSTNSGGSINDGYFPKEANVLTAQTLKNVKKAMRINYQDM